MMIKNKVRFRLIFNHIHYVIVNPNVLKRNIKLISNKIPSLFLSMFMHIYRCVCVLACVFKGAEMCQKSSWVHMGCYRQQKSNDAAVVY